MSTTDPTLDPGLRSWVESANSEGHDFPIQNLPFGVFGSQQGPDRIGVAIGDMVLDLHQAVDELALQDLPPETACARRTSAIFHSSYEQRVFEGPTRCGRIACTDEHVSLL